MVVVIPEEFQAEASYVSRISHLLNGSNCVLWIGLVGHAGGLCEGKGWDCPKSNVGLFRGQRCILESRPYFGVSSWNRVALPYSEWYNSWLIDAIPKMFLQCHLQYRHFFKGNLLGGRGGGEGEGAMVITLPPPHQMWV